MKNNDIWKIYASYVIYMLWKNLCIKEHAPSRRRVSPALDIAHPRRKHSRSKRPRFLSRAIADFVSSADVGGVPKVGDVLRDKAALRS